MNATATTKEQTSPYILIVRREKVPLISALHGASYVVDLGDGLKAKVKGENDQYVAVELEFSEDNKNGTALTSVRRIDGTTFVLMFIFKQWGGLEQEIRDVREFKDLDAAIAFVRAQFAVGPTKLDDVEANTRASL